MEYYSARKKNEIMPFAGKLMDLEITILREVRKRMTNTIWYHLYVESKIWQKWTYLPKQKQIHRHRKQTCGCQGVGVVGEGGIGSLGLADANYYIENE